MADNGFIGTWKASEGFASFQLRVNEDRTFMMREDDEYDHGIVIWTGEYIIEDNTINLRTTYMEIDRKQSTLDYQTYIAQLKDGKVFFPETKFYGDINILEKEKLIDSIFT